MQFISYDSDGSVGSQPLPKICKKVEAVSAAGTSIQAAHVPKAWTVQSSSGESSEDESEEDQGGKSVELLQKENKSALLNAEALFASTSSKPKFLRRNIDDKFEVSAVKAHTYDTINSSASQKNSRKNEPTGNITRAVPMASLTSKLSTIAKSGEPISESDLALKKKLDDRESAKVVRSICRRCVLCIVMLIIKFAFLSVVGFTLFFSLQFLALQDRVKRQRLSGQSGIGSDFKEWRSEEEMRQRQMYD